MKRGIGCVLLLSIFIPVGLAAQAQNPTFRSSTDLVLVPVVVTKDGKHLSGLKQQDFVLLEDGKEQSISVFDEVVAQNRKTRFEQPPAGYFTNVSVPDQAPARLIVFLIDLINTSSQKQAHAKEGVVKYLAHAGLGTDPIALIALRGDGLHIIHDFSTDPAVLMAAVKKLSGEVSQGQTDATHKAEFLNDKSIDRDSLGNVITPGITDEGSAFDILSATDGALDQRADGERSGLTLAYLQQLTRYLAGVPGRKTLIWATEGIRYVPVNEQSLLGSHNLRGRINDTIANTDFQGAGALNDLFPKTWDGLAAANIAVYPVDLEEVVNPTYTSGRSRLSTSSANSGVLKGQTMNAFPDNTGGTYCELQPDMDTCFRAAIEDSAEYYMLAFYPRRHDTNTHKIQVKVSTAGAKVRARTSYSFQGSGETKQGRSGVMQALASPLDSTAIPLAMRWVPAKNSGTKSGFELRVDPQGIGYDGPEQNHFRIDVMGATSDATGKFTMRFQKTIEARPAAEGMAKLRSAGLGYTDVLEVPPGTDTVRFAVQDTISGRVGTVTARIPKITIGNSPAQ